MADFLVKAGKFPASRWRKTLSAEIGASNVAGMPDDAETYFRAVLSALERLLAEDGDVTAAEIEERRRQWKRAYLRTPHGRPVELSRGESLA